MDSHDAEATAENRELLHRSGAIDLLAGDPEIGPQLAAALRGSAPVNVAANPVPRYRVVLRVGPSETAREYATDGDALPAFDAQRRVLWSEVCRDFEGREVSDASFVALECGGETLRRVTAAGIRETLSI